MLEWMRIGSITERSATGTSIILLFIAKDIQSNLTSQFLIAYVYLLQFASLITVKGEYPLTDTPRVDVQRAGADTLR